MQITITVNAPEISAAIHALAKALEVNAQGTLSAKNALATTITVLADNIEANGKMNTPGETIAPTQYIPPAQVQAIAPAPAPAPIPMAITPVPVTPAPVAISPPAAVPTTAQTYSLEQLAVAATQLVDAGRRAELVTLLGSFGVQALTALPKEQYGNFATQLRSMGAKI